jgi:carboxylate-amine ligase
MSQSPEEFTLGVEEEYQLIDPATRALRTRGDRVLSQAHAALGNDVQPELQRAQLETVSPVCHSLADVRAALMRARRAVIAAAATEGTQVAAVGTHPFSHWDDQEITPKARYQGIAEEYQQLAREQLVCGCHVHVGLHDREAAIQVLNRARVWLAPLLALTANSPFWLGADTGYASYRTQLWGRFPLAGQPYVFASRVDYDAVVRALVATGSIEDATKIYWDIRLPEHIDTVEVRVTDVCLSINEAVMVAGLVRALVRTCYEQAQRGEPFPAVRPELLRAARQWAARSSSGRVSGNGSPRWACS